jgi:hypothetical protein
VYYAKHENALKCGLIEEVRKNRISNLENLKKCGIHIVVLNLTNPENY